MTTRTGSSEAKPYRKVIMDHGGGDKKLERESVSPAVLESLIANGDKTELWTEPMGVYVGQCVNPWRRIIRQHGQEVLQGSRSTLHHYILWMGNGARSTTFIRLWAFPQGTNKDDPWYQMCTSILEAIVCKGFKAHHGILDPTDRPTTKTHGLGLNIMTPLVQGGSLCELLRNEANAGTLHSPDQQIKYWSSFRNAQKRSPAATRLIFQRDFNVILKTALGTRHDQYGSFREWFQQPIQPRTNDSIPGVSFTGSLDASIAFILDFAATSAWAGGGPSSTNNNIPATLPPALQGCNFTTENCLTWTHDFKSFRELGGASINQLVPGEQLLRNHEAMLRASQAKIIFLCGPRCEAIIKALVGNHVSCHMLKLQGSNLMMYLEHGPESAGYPWSTSAGNAAKLSEAIRFAVNIIGLGKIRPYFVESSTVVTYILRQAKVEQEGGERIISANLNDGVRMWLARKGISETQDLQQIEQPGGSLARGLLMVLHALPRRNPTRAKQRPRMPAEADLARSKKKSRTDQVPFDPSAFEKVKRLVAERVEEREARFLLSHSDLPALEDPGAPLNSREVLSRFVFQLDDVDPQPTDDTDHELVAEEQSSPVPFQSQEDSDQFGPSPEPVADELPSQVYAQVEEASAEAATKASIGDSEAAVELDKLFETEYRYTVNPQRTSLKELSICNCLIVFCAGLDVGDGNVWIKIVLFPPSQRHPYCYATEATNDDPASRLAIRVRFHDSMGTEVMYYERKPGVKMMYRANAFVDILEQKSNEEIARTPRRFLKFKNEARLSPALEPFRGGKYT
ncbi:hypothetical protein BDW59DRAFT_173765 [Aspergillus cavernicola]|uniref:Uncharacterized protein n=1 Tax=Aspergillus cavernicola TaxID=176166 RepID=A0ABR4I5V8_9EURO